MKKWKNMQVEDKVFYMFITFILLWFIVLLFNGCSKEQIIFNNCLSDPDPNAMCTMDIDYQCGCNGYVYINPCHAYKDGVNRIRPFSIDDPEDNCYNW